MSENIEMKNTGSISWFFFAAIPGVLAGAALMWLAFYTGIIDWQKQKRVEGRMDTEIGIHEELTPPFDLIIRETGCLQINRAYLDGSAATVYVENSCHRSSGSWEIRWNQIALDGSVIAIKIETFIGEIEYGETKQVTEKLKVDSRTSKVIVWSVGR